MFVTLLLVHIWSWNHFFDTTQFIFKCISFGILIIMSTPRTYAQKKLWCSDNNLVCVTGRFQRFLSKSVMKTQGYCPLRIFYDNIIDLHQIRFNYGSLHILASFNSKNF